MSFREYYAILQSILHVTDSGGSHSGYIDLNETSNLDLFFAKMSAYYSTTLYKRESVFIFDEVQQFPRARQLIKYLVADGRYDFIETGSLIRLKKNVKDIIIPSEEEHIEMFPLDFEEFLWALGDNATAPFIRQYILVGGMPQAVLAYVNTKDFEAVDAVKRRILKLYRDDVSEFAEGYGDNDVAIKNDIVHLPIYMAMFL